MFLKEIGRRGETVLGAYSVSGAVSYSVLRNHTYHLRTMGNWLEQILSDRRYTQTEEETSPSQHLLRTPQLRTIVS